MIVKQFLPSKSNDLDANQLSGPSEDDRWMSAIPFSCFFTKEIPCLLDCGFQNSMKMSPSDTREIHCQVSREDSAAHPIKPVEENRLLWLTSAGTGH